MLSLPTAVANWRDSKNGSSAPNATDAGNEESCKNIQHAPPNVLYCSSIFMQNQILMPIARLLPPPAVLLYPVLPPQTSSTTMPNDSDSLALERPEGRATQITVVLNQILDYKGYYHGGLNE